MVVEQKLYLNCMQKVAMPEVIPKICPAVESRNTILMPTLYSGLLTWWTMLPGSNFADVLDNINKNSLDLDFIYIVTHP